MIYLLKASAILMLFYLGYRLFLQRETFFQSNRWFLLTGLVTALIIPLVVIPIEVIKEAPAVTEFAIPMDQATSVQAETSFSLDQILLGVYLLGIVVFLLKFLIQIGSLFTIIFKNKIYRKPPYKFVELNDKVPPFSFFNWIVFNPTQFKGEELDQIILHEKAHADQYHSIDILSIQLASIVFWFNPFIWLYKKELEQNLEFIADQSTQAQSSCSKSYQYLLLKSSVPKYQLALANNFYNSLIKKRIVMLHKNRSNKMNQWKYFLMLPVLALFIMSFNTKEIVSYEASENVVNETQANAFFGDAEAIIITKETSDDKLDELTESLKDKGITVKFKGVKRNDAGEITDISISAKTEKSSANISESNDEGISPIKLTVDGDSISFGNTNAWHHKDGNVVFFSKDKDGKHTIHESKDGDNVFFYKHSEDEHERDGDKKHEYKYRVISGDDDKVIIKSGGKVIDLKKHKDGSVFVHRGEGDGEHKVVEIKGKGKNGTYVIRKDKDGNYGKSKWKSKDGSVIIHNEDREEEMLWEEEDGKSIKIQSLGKGKNKIFISTDDSDKEPLIIKDGKEISQKDMEDLDSEDIEKVEVLKGESATKKYGDKGKDGVVIITSKKKKD